MVDDALWQEVATATLPMLYKIASGMLRNTADAQDAVQTALLKAWETRGRARDDAFRAYLTRILINECRNIQRRRQRVTPVEEVPAQAAPQDSQMREVLEAIAALPEKLRLPLYLKYLEDFSEQEAAQALGVPVTTFRSRLHRARQALKKALNQEVIV